MVETRAASVPGLRATAIKNFILSLLGVCCISQLKKFFSQIVGFVKYMSFFEYFQEHGVLRPRTNPFPCPMESCGKWRIP